jgi:hypothetical protein
VVIQTTTDTNLRRQVSGRWSLREEPPPWLVLLSCVTRGPISGSLSGPTEHSDNRIVDEYLRALETVHDAQYDELEREFVAVAQQFSRLHRISQAAWRDVATAGTAAAQSARSIRVRSPLQVTVRHRGDEAFSVLRGLADRRAELSRYRDAARHWSSSTSSRMALCTGTFTQVIAYPRGSLASRSGMSARLSNPSVDSELRQVLQMAAAGELYRVHKPLTGVAPAGQAACSTDPWPVTGTSVPQSPGCPT